MRFPGYTKFQKYAKNALIKNYGFAPASLCDISILHYHYDNRGNCQYVEFQIGGHVYSYDGVTLNQIM